MRIAIPVWEERISPVYDTASTFLLVDIENCRVVGQRMRRCRSLAPDAVVRLLLKEGVNVLICGAISREPARLVEINGIHLIPFIAGMVEPVLNSYAGGESISEFRMPGCRRGHWAVRAGGKNREGDDFNFAGKKAKVQPRRHVCQLRKEKDGMAGVPPAVAGVDAIARRSLPTITGFPTVVECAGDRPVSRGQEQPMGIRNTQENRSPSGTEDAGGAVAEQPFHRSSDGRLQPMSIILATARPPRLAALAAGLHQTATVRLTAVKTGEEVRNLLAATLQQMVIIDEELVDISGLDLARLLAAEQPFVNTALVSDLPAAEFHDHTEGLGVLMQLPSPPLEEHGAALLAHYETIQSIWHLRESTDIQGETQ